MQLLVILCAVTSVCFFCLPPNYRRGLHFWDFNTIIRFFPLEVRQSYNCRIFFSYQLFLTSEVIQLKSFKANKLANDFQKKSQEKKVRLAKVSVNITKTIIIKGAHFSWSSCIRNKTCIKATILNLWTWRLI